MIFAHPQPKMFHRPAALGWAAALLLLAGAARGQTRPPLDPTAPSEAQRARLTRLAAADTLGDLGNPSPNAFAAADFNGDGLDDLVIGAPFALNSSGAAVGAVYIILGSTAPPGTDIRIDGADPRALVIRGVLPGARFGFSVATGDLDGDGSDDLAVGAPGPVHGEAPGGAFIFFDPIAASSTGITTPSAELCILVGSELGDAAGWSLAAADLDLDGADELILGAPRVKAERAQPVGAAYILKGSSAGLRGASLALASPSPPTLGRVLGTRSRGAFGTAISAGDINGDGRPDLALSAPKAGTYSPSAPLDPNENGIVYILAGGEDLFQEIDLEAKAFQVWGVYGGGRIGLDLFSADFDGDALDDLIIGEPASSPQFFQGDRKGTVAALFGQALTFPGTLLEPRASEPTVFAFARSNSFSGGAANGNALAADDADGDGALEPIVAAWRENRPPLAQSGSIRLFPEGSFLRTGMVALDDAHSSETLVGGRANAWLGSAAISLIDINGDGSSDLAGSSMLGRLDSAFGQPVSRGYVFIRLGDPASLATLCQTSRRFPAAGAGLLPLGPRVSSRVRAGFDFPLAGAGSFTAACEYTRSSAAVSGLGPAEQLGACLWRLTADNADWTQARLEFHYTPQSIASIPGLDPANLALWTAPDPAGPWTKLTSSIDPISKIAAVSTPSLGWFVLAGPSAAATPAGAGR